MNITKFLIDERIAKCQKHAENIIAKLELYKLYNDGKLGEIMTRARCYRDWRNAGESSDVAATKAIAGEAAPTPLLQEAAHTKGE
jgi:hypothetical protein